jgi:ParB family transcriptional regulator, chromosome partitioning protein
MKKMKKRLTEVQFKKIIGNLKIGHQTIDIAKGVLVDGKPQSQFATELGISKGAVSQAVSRVFSALNKPVRNFAEPLNIDLDLIDEDPHQPRKDNNPGFSQESLNELAETIRHRGVKSPISIRHNPDDYGRYIINHGARRYRASKIAGYTTVPAFIDDNYDEIDQIIENLQRNELTASEIAEFIGREVARGKKMKDIAKEIGKSPTFVTHHYALLNLPPTIAEAYNSGRANDVTVINDLVTVYKKNPQEVIFWLADESQEITRSSVRLLREFLDVKGTFVNSNEEENSDHENKNEPFRKSHERNVKRTFSVQVKHKRRLARLILTRMPLTTGYTWLRYEDDEQEVEADLSQLQLVAIIEN